MQINAFTYQRHSNQHQKTQCQHFYRRVAINKFTDGFCSKHHHHYRQHHCNNHHLHVLGHAHSRDHRVKRKHHINKRNLHQHSAKTGNSRTFLFFFTFQRLVYLQRGFGQQKQPPTQQNQVTARELHVQQCKQHRIESHDPGQQQQEQDAHTHSQTQPQDTGLLSLRLGKPADQHGNKNDIVDTENNFQQRQCGQCHPGFRGCYPFHFRIPC